MFFAALFFVYGDFLKLKTEGQKEKLTTKLQIAILPFLDELNRALNHPAQELRS